MDFGPEEGTNYELGFKSDWFDHRFRLNVTGFQADYEGLVIPVLRVVGGAPSTVPANVGTAQYRGLEIEATLEPVDGLTFSGAYSYLKTELDGVPECSATITEDCVVTPSGRGLLPRSNDERPSVPEHRFSASAEYRIELGGARALTPRFDYFWVDDVNFNTTPNEWYDIATQEAYGVANFRLSWDAPEDDWSVYLAVNNLFDEFYYVNLFDLDNGTGFGTVEGQPAQPRQWAAGVRRRF